MAETKEVTRPWDSILERFSKKNPDKDYTGEGIEDSVLSEVLEELEGYDSRLAEFEENRAKSQQMVDLFNRSPKSSKYMLALAAGEGDPLDYLLDIFGPDILDALQSEEGRAKLIESENKWMEKKAAEESGMQARMDNYEKSINDLVTFASEKGLSDEQAVAIFEKVNQIGFDAIEGIYSPESYEMAYNAMNYKTDVEMARKEGERDGRNTRIEEKLKKVTKPADMPPTVGGQGAGVSEPKPVKKKNDMFGLNL